MPARPPHLPTVWERLALDASRRGQPLPGGVGNSTIAKMVEKGWIEPDGGARRYKITAAGLEAMKRKIPTG